MLRRAQEWPPACRHIARVVASRRRIATNASVDTKEGAAYARTVAVGISGGVDSAVSAFLLKEAGWNVIGVFMRNWDGSDEAGTDVCTLTDDLSSAKGTADQLGIPLHIADFSRQYWNSVFEPFLHAYASGSTPNPDVYCNRYIKFGAFKSWAKAVLGADFVATGHYAQLLPAVPWWDASSPQTALTLPREHCDSPRGDGQRDNPPSGGDRRVLLTDAPGPCPRLLSAVDPVKDQSDFLSLVPGPSLRRVVFPVGGLLKAHVRDVASAAGLVPASRRDSYGICFVGKRRLGEFLGSYLPLTCGTFVDIESGRCVGTHTGAEAWTCGQGARVGGKEGKLYVAGRWLGAGGAGGGEGDGDATAAARDSLRGPPWHPARLAAPDGTRVPPHPSPSRRTFARGTVFVAPGRAHPSLFFDSLVVEARAFAWVAGQPPPLVQRMVQEALTQQQGRNPHPSDGPQRGSSSSCTAPPAPPPPQPCPFPVRYRVRHRQDDLGAATVTVMTASQYQAQEAARCVTRQWHLQAPPRMTWGSSQQYQLFSAAEGDGAGGREGRAARGGGAMPSGDGPSDEADPLLLVVRFPVPQRAVTPGQIMVLYDECTGGSMIEQAAGSDDDAGGSDHTDHDGPPLAQNGSSTPQAAAASSFQPPWVTELQQCLPADHKPWPFAGRTCLGGGAILAAGPSLWDRGLQTPANWRE